MRVNDIKVTTLKSTNFAQRNVLGSLFLTFVLILLWFTSYQNGLRGLDAAFISLITLGTCGVIYKHISSEKEDKVRRIINGVLESDPVPITGRVKIVVDEEVIDRVITTLQITQTSKTSSPRRLEKIISTALILQKYNRVIARMFSQNLIYKNQAILTIHKSRNYFDLTKHVINLGIVPDKVFYEDASDYFAIVLEDIEDSNLVQITQNSLEPYSRYEFIKTNDIIDFVKQIKID